MENSHPRESGSLDNTCMAPMRPTCSKRVSFVPRVSDVKNLSIKRAILYAWLETLRLVTSDGIDVQSVLPTTPLGDGDSGTLGSAKQLTQVVGLGASFGIKLLALPGREPIV